MAKSSKGTVEIVLTVRVEVGATTPEQQKAAANDALYEVDKALDYWFGHTDRPMTNLGVRLS